MDLDIEKLAKHLPVAALLLLEGAEPVPTVIPVDVSFTAASGGGAGNGITIGSTAKGAFPSLLGAPFIVHNITYTIERPNADSGSVLKGQQDFYTTQTPYVDVSTRVIGDRLIPKYAIEQNNSSIANFCALWHERWPSGWLLPPAVNLALTCRLTRTLVAAEDPYNVRFSWNGWSAYGLQADKARALMALGHVAAQERALGALKERGWPTIETPKAG